MSDKTNPEPNLVAVFEDIEKFCKEKIKNEEFGTAPPTTGQPKKPAPVKDPKSKILISAVQESNPNLATYEVFKSEAKVNCLKRLILLKKLAKSKLNIACRGYAEATRSSEALVRHNYAQQMDMFRKLQALISEKIESEQKIDNLLIIHKFQIAEDESIKNYLVPEPVPLFDADAIQWDFQ